jgi:NAD(P)-dependent dehydrogenase (short-subunit alcohol dehydrogenase family)
MATVLVVGADRGIARAIAVQLHQRGDQVIAACLGDGAGLAALGIRAEPRVDVTSAAAVQALAARLAASATRLDWLLHVAGVLGLDELGRLDYDELRRQFEINALGPLRTVEALRGLLADQAKVGIVTSRVGSLGDNSSGGMYAYRMSKAAANMAGLNLHHDLSPRGISVLMLHPGMVATDLTRDFPGDHSYIQPEEAAAGLIRDMDELTPKTSGRFQHSNGEYLPW